MRSLYVCNVSSNYVSKVGFDNNKEEKIYISTDEKLLGSHGIDFNDEKLFVAANDNYNFYEVDINTKNVRKYYIGMMTNDLRIKNDYMYLICSESNCLVVYDMIEDKLCYEIGCGNYPHSMDISEESGLISITNMHNNQLTIVDYNKNDLIRNIRTGNLPMKSKFYRGGRYIFVCESNLGDEAKGTISVYDSLTGERENNLTLDKSPIDMFFDYESNVIFVSNHLGNCISLIDLIEFKEISRINISGNPRGIYKKGRFLYVVMSDKDKLLKYDILTQNEKFINLGSDPTCIYCD